PVEGAVDLDRVEAGGVAGEPGRPRQVVRVEDAPPVRVVPPRAADAYGPAHLALRVLHAPHRRPPCHDSGTRFITDQSVTFGSPTMPRRREPSPRPASPGGRRWRRQPEARPQQILDAARRTFASKGYFGAT